MRVSNIFAIDMNRKQKRVICFYTLRQNVRVSNIFVINVIMNQQRCEVMWQVKMWQLSKDAQLDVIVRGCDR